MHCGKWRWRSHRTTRATPQQRMSGRCASAPGSSPGSPAASRWRTSCAKRVNSPTADERQTEGWVQGISPMTERRRRRTLGHRVNYAPALLAGNARQGEANAQHPQATTLGRHGGGPGGDHGLQGPKGDTGPRGPSLAKVFHRASGPYAVAPATDFTTVATATGLRGKTVITAKAALNAVSGSTSRCRLIGPGAPPWTTALSTTTRRPLHGPCTYCRRRGTSAAAVRCSLGVVATAAGPPPTRPSTRSKSRAWRPRRWPGEV